MAEKVKRKLMAHFIDDSMNSGTPNWWRLGEDLEEFSVDLDADVEVQENIIGTRSFIHNGYAPTGEVETYYARDGETITEVLQNIIDTEATGDETLTNYLEVHMWDGDSTTGYVAYEQECHIVPASSGGDTSGYQIPFTIYLTGEKTAGTFVPNGSGSGTFTAATA